jgi:hypothetical protein
MTVTDTDKDYRENTLFFSFTNAYRHLKWHIAHNELTKIRALAAACCHSRCGSWMTRVMQWLAMPRSRSPREQR